MRDEGEEEEGEGVREGAKDKKRAQGGGEEGEEEEEEELHGGTRGENTSGRGEAAVSSLSLSRKNYIKNNYIYIYIYKHDE